MKLLPSVIFIVLAFFQLAHAETDPLAFARQGYIACSMPTKDNTCWGFSHFDFRADGRIFETDEVAFAESPLLTVAVPPYEIFVTHNEICGRPRNVQTIENVVIRREGISLDKAEAAPLAAGVLKAMNDLAGKATCLRFENEGLETSAQFIMDGKPIEGSGVNFLWVKSESGLRLSPLS